MKEAKRIDLYDALVILEKMGADEGLWHWQKSLEMLIEDMSGGIYQTKTVEATGLQAKVLGPDLLSISMQQPDGTERELTYSGKFMVYWEDSALKHRPLKKGEAI